MDGNWGRLVGWPQFGYIDWRMPGAGGAVEPTIAVIKIRGALDLEWNVDVTELSTDGSATQISVRVDADSFAAFAELSFLFDELAEGRVTTLDELRTLLYRQDIPDVTERWLGQRINFGPPA